MKKTAAAILALFLAVSIAAACAEGGTFELVLALKTPDGVLFSRESSLALAASEKAASYRVSLDRLLADVFDALREWPKGDCSLRVWLDGMMVFEKSLRFETGS